MEAAIGGRHTVTEVITTPTRRRTAALITGVMVIITQRLTMTLLREPMAGNRQPTALTVRQRAAPVTILTPALMRAALQFRRLMAVEAQHRHITRTLAPMLRLDRDQARTLSGVVPMCREETRALPWVITRARTER